MSGALTWWLQGTWGCRQIPPHYHVCGGDTRLDYSIDSCITPACIRSIRSDRILRSGPWARSRRTAVAAFLWNHRKKERHCASSLCNDHVHHIRKVQRCSFVSLFIRYLSRMLRLLVTYRGQPEVDLLLLVEMGTAPPIIPGYDMLQ